VTALITTGDQIGDPGILGETSQFSNCQMAVPPGFKFSAPSDGGNGHVYEYVENPGTWTNARAAAAARTFRGLNGHLVTITSAFENAFVGSFRGANQDLRGWIGLTDEVTEGTFQWITGEPVTYTNWNIGEPSNGSPPLSSDEDYVEIFAATVWNDNTNDALNANGLRINQGYLVEYEVNPFAPAFSQNVTVNFSGLLLNGASVSTYTESELNVVAGQADWTAVTTYGNPAPFVQFMAAAGSSVAGQVRVTAGGASFTFKSVDLYSSTTPIPYTFTGLLGSTPVFSVTATQPPTFGAFATVVNPQSAAVIDTMVITLTNAAAACCSNPMGLDTIVIGR
jgi:lectin-like protein